MKDLRNPKVMWLKAGLFVVIGAVCAGLIWAEAPSLKTALLLGLGFWAFCRAYYFAFYVLEKYADPAFRYAGLLALARYIFAKARNPEGTNPPAHKDS